MRKITPVVVAVFLTVCILGGMHIEDSIALETREPTYISGNKEFTEENGVVAGSGIEDDPYIIESWEINAADHRYGVFIENTTAYFVIRNCKVYGADEGNIKLANVKNGKIVNCEISSSTFHGIWLVESSNSEIFGNTMVNNWHGIYLLSSLNNAIQGNMIESNGDTGLLLLFSSGNLIHHNNLIENNRNAYDDGENRWDNGSEGNYWSDYEGEDADGDGIGDTPYEIPEAGNQDRHPLMKPWESIAIISIKYSGPDEIVTIKNWTEEDMDMTGWKLISEPEQTFAFPDGFVLSADGIVRTHSGPEAEGKESLPTDLFWTEGYVWNDEGDTAMLVGPEGKEADRYRY